VSLTAGTRRSLWSGNFVALFFEVASYPFRLVALNLDLSSLHAAPAAECFASSPRNILNFRRRKMGGKLADDDDRFSAAL